MTRAFRSLGHEWESVDKALSYLASADRIPHRTEGEKVLLARLPSSLGRVLDLGTGDGRLLALVRVQSPDSEGVALDFSDTMVSAARSRFTKARTVAVSKHDLRLPLPAGLGRFDAVVSSFAIHHLTHRRKKRLYGEVFDILRPGGVFCNLEHVASPSAALHRRFLAAMGLTSETEDRSNILLDMETQLGWLREIGFTDVDCDWKWLELALLAGVKPKNQVRQGRRPSRPASIAPLPRNR